MIVVTTPTGQIGHQVVEDLLAAKEPVRVVARDPSRLKPEVRAQVELVQGAMEDAAAMKQALAGAESLFLCIPPSFSVPDSAAYYCRLTQVALDAMRENGVKRVVAVSAIGRQWMDQDLGLISASLAKDVLLEKAGLDVRALWCPGFMDNSLRDLRSLKGDGVFYGVANPEVKMPYAATRDIGAMAAKLLQDRTWKGPGGVAVLGPEDLSVNDMTAILTQVLGKPVRYQQVPPEGFAAQLKQHGASESVARDFLKMMAAKDRGLDRTEPRTAENTTPTSYRTWCERVLQPAYSKV